MLCEVPSVQSYPVVKDSSREPPIEKPKEKSLMSPPKENPLLDWLVVVCDVEVVCDEDVSVVEDVETSFITDCTYSDPEVRDSDNSNPVEYSYEHVRDVSASPLASQKITGRK